MVAALALRMAASAVAASIALIVLAGVFNGSWNVSFSPRIGVDFGTLDFPASWFLFQLYAALLNIPVCIYWAGGPTRVSWIVQETEPLTILLICLFSLIWGLGSVGFGLACKIAGVGMGTNLTIGVVTVLGAILPLILNKVIASLSGIIVLVGLAVCCFGLFFSMRALQMRDRHERNHGVTPKEHVLQQEDMDKEGERDLEADQVRLADASGNPALEFIGQQSTMFKVAVCVGAGILATQLQFAFVFGQDMIDLAESQQGPGSTTSSGSAATIWLFAFTISAPVSLIYGLYKTTCPWYHICSAGIYRHGIIFLTATMPWVSHIHLYGISNTILPKRLAAAVSWPVLMMTTVLTGVVWSFLLGEWSQSSSNVLRQLYIGLAFICFGILILILSFIAT